jgi:AAA+ ATPase superfamily predicted ATPase
VVVLFDLLPKEDRNDLSDREEELNKLKGLEGLYSPITLVLGFRRTGKSSLIKVALKESEFSNFLLDKLTTRRRYYAIMQAVAKCSTWSEIKRTLQIREGSKSVIQGSIII